MAETMRIIEHNPRLIVVDGIVKPIDAGSAARAAHIVMCVNGWEALRERLEAAERPTEAMKQRYRNDVYFYNLSNVLANILREGVLSGQDLREALVVAAARARAEEGDG